MGVKFSTNGSRIDAERAEWLRGSDYVDVQISLDGATAAVNDRVRGVGSYATALRAMELLDGTGFKLSVVVTRENAAQLDDFKALADRFGATLRLTRLRPSGRGADVWDELHPTEEQQRDGLRLAARARRRGADRRLVLPPGRVRAVAAGPEPVRRGAGRVPDRPGRRRVRVPVRDPRDVPRGQRARARGFAHVWRESDLFRSLREPQAAGACGSCGMYDACRGGCMAAKFFTGLPLAGPDPECVFGHGETALRGVRPKPSVDHSRVRVVSRACNESPV